MGMGVATQCVIVLHMVDFSSSVCVCVVSAGVAVISSSHYDRFQFMSLVVFLLCEEPLT